MLLSIWTPSDVKPLLSSTGLTLPALPQLYSSDLFKQPFRSNSIRDNSQFLAILFSSAKIIEFMSSLEG